MMGGAMGSDSATSIDEIRYNESGMTHVTSINSSAITPHGISLSDDGATLVTAGLTNDYLSVIINTTPKTVEITSLDPLINDNPTLVLNRLKPLEIVQKDQYAFVSCTGGEWQNINTGNSENVNGQIQVWNTATLEHIETHEFSLNSKPWHIDCYPEGAIYKVYVVLSGESGGSGSGVACLLFDGSIFEQEWIETDSEFDTLHGIAISSDRQYVYVSGRGDGNLYKLDAQSGELLDTLELVSTNGGSLTGGITITQ